MYEYSSKRGWKYTSTVVVMSKSRPSFLFAGYRRRDKKGETKKENAGGEASNAGRASRATKEGLVTENDYSGEKAAQCSYMRVRNKPWWPRQSTSVLFAMPPSPGESKNKKRKKGKGV